MVVGTVTKAWFEEPVSGYPMTYARIAVESTLKGAVLSGELVVGVPGGVMADGRSLIFVGTPRTVVGARALVLATDVDGVTARPSHWDFGFLTEDPTTLSALDAQLRAVAVPAADSPMVKLECPIDAATRLPDAGCMSLTGTPFAVVSDALAAALVAAADTEGRAVAGAAAEVAP